MHYIPQKLSKDCECDFLEKVFRKNGIKNSTELSFVVFIFIAHQEETKTKRVSVDRVGIQNFSSN